MNLTFCTLIHPDRRREQNVKEKGLGFNWGPAGVSTALFTGVYLADILKVAKPKKVNGVRPLHVIFEGYDFDLPQGPYGTSQRLSWASDRKHGILIAWAMNGIPLEPDHGFPLRVVCPGMVGGRSVVGILSFLFIHHSVNAAALLPEMVAQD